MSDRVKKCSVCEEEKPLDAFSEAPTCKDGHKGQCKKCIVRLNKERYKGELKKPESYRFLTLKEWNVFKEAEDDPVWNLYWNLLAKCGLRLSEGLAAGPKQINVDTSIIAVATLKRPGRPIFDVDIPPDLAKALLALPTKQERWFHWTPHQVWRRFRLILWKAKLPETRSPHSLRHLKGLRTAHVTKGDVVKVAKALRHKSLKTAEHYIHVEPEERKKVAEDSWEGM